jgi:hypothetical protein
MLAEIVEVETVEQISRRLREKNLTAVAAAGNPRRSMHVDPEIRLLGHERLTCVDADPYAHGTACELSLSVDGRRCGVLCSRERDEERIALGIYLDPSPVSPHRA